MTPSLTQRQAALVGANQVRFGMCAVKREVARGELELKDAIVDPRAQNLRVCQLLRAQPRVGPGKAAVICERLWISEERRVSELTDRQKTLVAVAGSQPVTRSAQLRLSLAAQGVGELVIA